jgi:tRNA dimethylallyltransferase
MVAPLPSLPFSHFLPILAGPTGSGKTKLVTSLSSDRFEVVSFDSRQVYSELPIGTTMPTPEEQKDMPHHLVGTLYANESLNARSYSASARKAVSEIWQKGKIPILVCGSGFYLRAFLNGMFPVPEILPHIKEEAQNMPLAEAIEIIKEKDILALQNIGESDIYRIRRILEVVLSGTSWSDISQVTVGGFLKEHPGLVVRGYWLDWNRDELYARINERVLDLLTNGMIEETKIVLEKYGETCPGLGSLGYNFALDFLHGNIDTNSFIERLAQSHRNYAKRQVTWFRKDPLLLPATWKQVFDEFKNIEKI